MVQYLIMAKLTYEQSADLVTKYVAGRTIMELATEFGLWPSGVISRLKTAKVYKVDQKLVAEQSMDGADIATLNVALAANRNNPETWTTEEEAAYDRLKAKGIVE